VFLGRHFLSQREIAIKKIWVDSSTPADKVEEVFKEAKSLQRLKHQNIIKLENVFPVKNQLVMMIEYLEGGDLKHFLSKRDCLSEAEVLTVMQQLVKAVNFCHRRGVIHRDLKPHNILLEKEDSL